MRTPSSTDVDNGRAVEEIALAPCPRCGTVPRLAHDHHDVDGDRYWTICECRTDWKLPLAEAIAASNRRAPSHTAQGERAWEGLDKVLNDWFVREGITNYNTRWRLRHNLRALIPEEMEREDYRPCTACRNEGSARLVLQCGACSAITPLSEERSDTKDHKPKGD